VPEKRVALVALEIELVVLKFVALELVALEVKFVQLKALEVELHTCRLLRG